MKKISKILITSFIIMCLLVSFALPAFAKTGNAEEYVSNTFKYASHDNAEVSDLLDEYVYSDSYFYESAYEANPSLATMSVQLAASSITTHDYPFGTDERYENAGENVRALLTDLGFEDIEFNDHYTRRPETMTMGVCCGQKTITADGEEVTLLAIVPRSAGYEREWNGNFTVGKDEIHEGFAAARDIVCDFARNYVSAHNLSGRVKVWLMGYSRGAAAVNLAGAALDQNPNLLGITVDPEDIYAYCFGTPRTVLADSDPDPEAEIFDNIHNYYADYDLVTYAALPSWGYSRYGAADGYTDLIYDSEKKEEMLTFLNLYFPMNYETYTNGEVGDPDNFYPKKVSFTGSGIALLNDDESDIPYTQKEFLDDRTDWIKKSLVGSPEVYVDGKYQKALSEFIQMYFGMSDTQDSVFNQNLGTEALIGFGLLYVDYQLGLLVKDQAALESLTQEELEELINMEDLMGEIGEDQSNIDFIPDEDHTELTGKLEEFENSAGGNDSAEIINDIKDLIKAIAEGLLSDAFQAAGEAAGALPDELANVTSAENMGAFTSFIEYILFGSDTESFDPFNLENESLKYAATFIGNAGSFMRVHNNEIITSWIRVNDPNYNLVAFDSQGGSDVESSYAVRTRGIILPADPTKDGNEFDGWYYDPECTVKYEGEDIEENLILYAGWKEPETEPESPSEPESTTEQESTTGHDVPQTGDQMPVVPAVILLAASAWGLAFAFRKWKEYK